MRPVLFGFEFLGRHVSVTSYSTFLVLGVVAAACVALFVAMRRGLPAGRVAAALLVVVASVALGARLWHGMTHVGLYTTNPWRLVSPDFKNWGLNGGLLGAALSGVVVCRVLRLDFWKMADAGAPAIAVGLALVRVGCFLKGCCFGEITGLPWGVRFPIGSPAYLKQLADGKIGLFTSGGTLPVHPTELYELAAAWVGLGLAVWVLDRTWPGPAGQGTSAGSGVAAGSGPSVGPGLSAGPSFPDGTAFLALMAWLAAFRWFNFSLRAKPDTLSIPLGFYPLLYVGVVVLCVGLIAHRRKAHESRPAGATGRAATEAQPASSSTEK